jgi:hypothetical protein
MHQITNNFIDAIGNGKQTQGYKAYIDIGNDRVAVTAEYSMSTLRMVIDEHLTSNPAAKLLRIEKV